MISLATTTTDVKFWREEQAFLREVRRDIATPRYFFNAKRIAPPDCTALKRARKARYLVMPVRRDESSLRLLWAYQAYCNVKGWPALTIDPRRHSPRVTVQLDLSPMSPFSTWNIYQPKLDLADARFLAVCSYAGYCLPGPQRVILFRVRHDQAEWVARELLALFDRCYARNLAEIDQIIQSEGA